MRRASVITISAILLLAVSCGPGRKITGLSRRQLSAQLALPEERQAEFHEFKDDYKPSDTLAIVDLDGHQSLIMNAVKEEGTGEMVAHDVLQAAVVTARFRNVPERRGRVELEYQIRVPEEMLDKEWQVRFAPRMVVMGDTISLDEVLVTGSEYRREQDRGYMRYRRFINSIITDTTRLVFEGQLERFIERNIPDLYKFREDSAYVTDAQFESVFGVNEADAVDHYTRQLLLLRNNWKKANSERMFRRYVKSPYRTGVRLDTVLAAPGGDFVYNYVQTLSTRPLLRKADILLSGSIYQQDKKIYSIPESEPLTFYISSLSSLVEERTRYISKTVYRRVEANTACYIDFKLGDERIVDTLSNNAAEIGRIKGNLASLLANKEFDLDSIVLTASGSPEGTYKYNEKLSALRSRSAGAYFEKYVKWCADSLAGERGVTYNLDDAFDEGSELKNSDIRFITHTVPENWKMLDALVRSDIVMDDGEKEEYFSHSTLTDPDAREAAMHSDRKYAYYRQTLYPRTRTVRFDFYLHRKGMVEESVETTVPDTVYRAGLQALKDRDYERAVTLLRLYGDYNSAVAFCALDYNASARAILENLEKTAQVNYLLAVINSRQGRDREAVECYLRSCAQNPSFAHRGNLDPEISSLIRQYGLNKQEDQQL